MSVRVGRVGRCGLGHSPPCSTRSIHVRARGAGRAPGRSAPSALRALRPLLPPWCERCGNPTDLAVPRCELCPPEAAHFDTGRVPLRRSGATRGAPAEVLGLARCRGGARRRDRGGRARSRRRRGHVGAARPVPTRRAGVRPGAGARRRARPPGRPPGAAAAPAPRRHRAAGAPLGRRTADRDARRVPGGPARHRPGSCSSTTCSRPARRSRPPPRPCAPPGRPRSTGSPRSARSRSGARCAVRVVMPILGWALVRVCGCPGMFPGSRCQPRAKRPT